MMYELERVLRVCNGNINTDYVYYMYIYIMHIYVIACKIMIKLVFFRTTHCS